MRKTGRTAVRIARGEIWRAGGMNMENLYESGME